jgi:polyhydroxyalkanoate synthesis regulator phasin
MLETLRRSVLASLGAAFITKDRVEEAMQRMVERGELTREEAHKVTEEMAATGEKELGQLRIEISKAVNNALEGLHIATQEQVQGLEERLDELQTRLKTLEERTEKAQSEDQGPDSP